MRMELRVNHAFRSLAAVFLCAALLPLAACKAATTENLPPADNEFAACCSVIQDACAAFNAYDVEKFLTYLTPEYASSGADDIRATIAQFRLGKGIGVQISAGDFQLPVEKEDGALEIRFVLTFTPAGLHRDQNEYCLMYNTPDGWKIGAINSYEPSVTS